MTEEKITFYRYVRHGEWAKWSRLGWQYVGELGPPHSSYSSLFKWAGDGDPVIPE